jgi:hypothetical protein
LTLRGKNWQGTGGYCGLFLTKRYFGVKEGRTRLTGHVTYLGENKNAYNILARKPGERRSCVRDRNTWNDDTRIKVDLKNGKPCNGIRLAQCRDRWRALVNRVMNIRVP